MQVVKLGEKINCPIVVCLGFFGTMHKGHIELLNRAKLHASVTNSAVALFTFDNNHTAVLGGDKTVVYTFNERLSIYNSLDVDYVITSTFDNGFKMRTGEQFLSQFSAYDLQGVVCGFDYCCGSDRLNAFGVRTYFKDLPVYIVEQISFGGQKVSTTLVRKCLLDNRLDEINALLTEPFFVTGEVAHGRGVGKQIGFPTANVLVPDEKLLPRGVYGGTTQINGVDYRVIVNVGNVPTFGVNYNTFEVHVLNYNGDLYGKTLKVSLTKYLRPITKFNSAQQLKEQLQHDKESVLND